jgi:hypothetical protein
MEVWVMPKQIVITAGRVRVLAELDDAPTAIAVAEALPIESEANRWGGEIYFSIPVEVDLEEGAREVLQAGELACWPSGNIFCIFFGPTPASIGSEIRAASAVNVVGRVCGSLEPLWRITDGMSISVAPASEVR